MKKKTDELIIELIESGSEISGSVSGAVICGLIAGVPGVILGAASGTMISKAFTKIGAELKSRFLGNREEIRIGAAFTFAANKLEENLNSGNTIRSDSFFESQNNRSDAEEVLEGVLLTAQKSYEEKKIKHIGCLYANIAFDDTIDKNWANHFIKLAENMSFRQYCLISIYNQKAKFGLERNVDISKNSYAIIRIDTMSELYDLRDKAIVNIRIPIGALDKRTAHLPPEHVNIEFLGERLYHLMNLDEIVDDDIYNIGAHLGIRNDSR